jgi:hypothetical protein
VTGYTYYIGKTLARTFQIEEGQINLWLVNSLTYKFLMTFYVDYLIEHGYGGVFLSEKAPIARFA